MLNNGSMSSFVLPSVLFADTVDEEYPDMCANTQASVSAVHFYEANHLPERYKNTLFVGDYSKVRKGDFYWP